MNKRKQFILNQLKRLKN